MTNTTRRMSILIAAFVAALAGAGLLLPTSARADDAAIGRDVIERQINAFLADDMSTAYSFAAPSIKRMYPDESRFFDMVKRGYHPASIASRNALHKLLIIVKIVPGQQHGAQRSRRTAPDDADRRGNSRAPPDNRFLVERAGGLRHGARFSG
jgi:hypothetical protein